MTKHVIIDTDIGFDPDDFVALLLCLKSDLEVDLVLTGGIMRDNGYKLAEKVLELTNNNHVPLYKGAESFFGELYNKSDSELESLMMNQDYFHKKHAYLDAIKGVVEGNKHVYYLGIGPMTTLANYLRVHNNHDKLTLVQMGGSNERSEFNFSGDIGATKYVFGSNIESFLVTSMITNNEENHASREFYESVKNSPLLLHKLLFSNIQRMRNFYLHDPLTVATIIDEKIVDFQPMKMLFTEGKQVFEPVKESNLRVSTNADYSKIVQMVDLLV